MIIENDKTKVRKLSNAIVLTLIAPGLGQVYCGKIVLGLVIMFLGSLIMPLTIIMLATQKVGVVWMCIIASVLLSLIAIVDSAYRAKKIGKGYNLKEYNKWYIYFLLAFINMGGVLPTTSIIKAKFAEPFYIPVAVNYPTLVPKDRVIANKLAYVHEDPKRGEMVIFKNLQNRHRKLIRRVVAIAGDTIEIRDNQVYVNSQKLEREMLSQYDLDNLSIGGKRLEGEFLYEINGDAKYKILQSKLSYDKVIHDFQKITVPQNYCFVLGDNRNLIHDDWDTGLIPLATIIGRVDYFYSVGKDRFRFGDLSN